MKINQPKINQTKSTSSNQKFEPLFTFKKSFDNILFITLIILLAVGAIMVFSSSTPYSLRTEGDSYFYFKKQIIFMFLGFVVMLIVSKINYKLYNSKFISWLAYIAGLGLMFSVKIPGIGVERNDALRWVKIAGVQFQPSEIMKICIIVFMSYFISKEPDRIKHFWIGIIPFCTLLLPVIGSLYIQDHLSAMVIIVITIGIMFFIAGAKIFHLTILGGLGTLGVALFIFSTEFRRQRFLIYLNPWEDPLKYGWQIIQSLYAISSGGIFGKGIGQGVEKYMYISEPHNDFIFSTWAEETGFIGVIFVILLFAIFIWRGISIASRADTLYGSLVAIGITSMIGIQAIFNIAVVSSAMPVTGISLPFCSYGGSSLLFLLISVGILLNISRQATPIKN